MIEEKKNLYWWDRTNKNNSQITTAEETVKVLSREEAVKLEKKAPPAHASRWNFASSFEEIDYTPFFRNEVDSYLLAATVQPSSSPAIDGWKRTGVTVKTKDVKGNCSVVITRKGAKHGLDVEVDFTFSVSYESEGEGVQVEGEFHIEEVSREAIEENAIEISKVKTTKPKKGNDVLKQDAENVVKGLKAFLTCEVFLIVEASLEKKATKR